MNQNEIYLAKIELARLADAEKGIREGIATSKAYKRLKDNEDFKLIFEEQYFKKEVVRLTMLLADPEVSGGKTVDSINSSLASCSELNSWFRHLETAEAFFQGELQSLRNRVAKLKESLDKVGNVPNSTNNTVGSNTANTSVPPEGV